MTDLSAVFAQSIKRSFLALGTSGKVFLAIIIGFFLFPILLRILSFFRRGGEGV